MKNALVDFAVGALCVGGLLGIAIGLIEVAAKIAWWLPVVPLALLVCWGTGASLREAMDEE